MVAWIDREFVIPRHRVIGEATVKCMTQEQLYDVSLRLAIALSPYLSRKTIIARTPEARIAARLFDADGPVISRLSDPTEWFGQLENAYSWNSRFWEQRALVTLGVKDFARARDFAEQAVGIEYHPLPMTTFALVKLSSIAQDKSLAFQQRTELLSEAIKLLDEAIRRGIARGLFGEIHPYHILFGRAVDASLAIHNKIDPQLDEAIRTHLPESRRQFGSDQLLVPALNRLGRMGY